MNTMNNYFKKIWGVDFEFFAKEGNNPVPICLVAREFFSGKTIRLWRDELLNLRAPPYETGEDTLFVAYYASAEIGCHLALGWALPTYVLDLCIEFKNLTNGIAMPFSEIYKRKLGKNLISALLYYGLDTIGYDEKKSMIDLIMRGGPWNAEEQNAIKDYCESDVQALNILFPKMIDKIQIKPALWRGEYMKAVAVMESNGIPVDAVTLHKICGNIDQIKEMLIREMEEKFSLSIFEGKTFKHDKFNAWTIKENIKWPKLPSGKLDLKDESFKEMALIHPQVKPIRELRYILGKMKLHELSVGTDNRNRCMLSAFSSKTGRNQPSNQKSIFGPAIWIRNMIQPPVGYCLAYMDWEQQEFGIAAALSNDSNMRKAYESGDPYLEFAKQTGFIPADGTKETHRETRELFKKCALGVLYGMGIKSMGASLESPEKAEELLRLHKSVYPVFWKWRDNILNSANIRCELRTVFGWNMKVSSDTKPTTVMNFPMQANGAEMLRIACIESIRRGVKVCMPVHDALLIEAPIDGIHDSIKITVNGMLKASKIVLDGFELRTEVKIIEHPQRFSDPRGDLMWNLIDGILKNIPDVN